ncbi:NAD(+)/NADH kinase [Clostridium folliculivorans]|uniref:NAD kinase n=1 Tax=Clostridium folliculivorans TaxID=2886038 RepID=A0A9W5XZZ2_9CLOT|nr:NAD(+)/NADH kinase [Clostridium folliculivorans]GKU24004.1 NAD kinase [Clostridium folliculivorans]GKU30119.1 NAD kinase [Clostridium folliculivorans]
MRNIGIFINPSKDKDGSIINTIMKKTQEYFQNSCVFRVQNHKDIENNKDIDCLMVLGGDGTILGATRDLAVPTDVPIFGINIGNLGFLTSVDIKCVDYALECLRNKKFRYEKRMMLKCNVQCVSGTYDNIALNDIVIAKGTLSRMVKYKILVDNRFYSSFKGDGVIISTPTGSTAYSFSAGGPLIMPSLEIITIVPICSHTPTMKPIVINGSSTVEILAESFAEEIFLTVDGQKSIKLSNNCEIMVGKNEKPCNLILLDEYDYFNVLRKKILSQDGEW